MLRDKGGTFCDDRGKRGGGQGISFSFKEEGSGWKEKRLRKGEGREKREDLHHPSVQRGHRENEGRVHYAKE